MMYKDMINYSDIKLINLLKSGTSQEKIFSAWILALREDKNIDIIHDNLLSTPEVGVRRHLITILASYDKKDILINFATLDPDIYVKATALKYLYNIEYENIIELSLKLYYDYSTDRIIRNEAFRILKDRKYKIENKILKEEIYKLDLNVSDDFLKYLFSSFKATEIDIDLLGFIIKSDNLFEYRKDILNWLKKDFNDNNMIRFLSSYNNDIYLSYLNILREDNLNINYDLLNSLPLVEEADYILYKIKYRTLNSQVDSQYTKNYIFRLYQYYQKNIDIGIYARFRDYLDIIIENVLEYNIDYNFSIDDKHKILKLLNNDYNYILKYDIELKDMYLEDINKLNKIFFN